MFEFICKPTRLLPAALALILAAPVVVRAEAPATQPDPSARPDRPRRERRQQRDQQRDPSAMLERMHEMVNGLDLSDEQKSKVDAIFTQARSDFEAMRQKWDQDKVAPRDRMQQGRDFLRGLKQKVEAVLTDQQKETLKEKREEMMARRRGDRRGPGAQGGQGERGDRQGPPAMVERLRSRLDQLNLTDDQKQKVKTVLDEVREKLQALRDENRGDRQAMREKGRKILEDARDRINEILTPEQREKLKEIRRSNRDDNGRQAPATQPDKT